MYRRFAKLGLTLAAAVMGSISASAATISISNLVDGPPTITTDFTGTTFTLAFEEARVSISLNLGTQPAIPAGTRSVTLNEPANDIFGPRVSDSITLTATNPVAGIQLITIFFQSDGALGFDANVGALPSNTPSIAETGALQDLSSANFLNSSPTLTINVASDLGTGAEVPEPSTLLLLATGLAGMVVLRHRSRRTESIASRSESLWF